MQEDETKHNIINHVEEHQFDRSLDEIIYIEHSQRPT
jgi:hypothetical protein